MARAVQAVAAAWGGLQDAEAQAAAGPPPGARARFRCHHPRDARLHWRALPSQPAVCDGTESRAAQHVVAAAAQLAAAQHARAGRHPRARRRAARLLRPSMRRPARGGCGLRWIGHLGARLQGTLRQGPGGAGLCPSVPPPARKLDGAALARDPVTRTGAQPVSQPGCAWHRPRAHRALPDVDAAQAA